MERYTLVSQQEQQPSSEIVFIFFADVCQSVVLYDRLGDEAAAELMMHCLSLTGERVVAHRGRLIDTRGDEVLCLFDRAEDALDTARDLHAMIRSEARMVAHDMAFRIGVHCGPVIESDGNLYGDAVNVAARLAGKAKADQTVLSSDVVGHFSEDPGDQVRPLGEASVRGKRGPRELFELLDQSEASEITEVSSREQVMRRAFILTLKHWRRQTRLSPALVRHLLGRGKDCDLRVDHPSVSRHHAEIRYRNGRFHLFDVSTNGTRIKTANGTVNVHRSDMPLPNRGVIILGRTEHLPEHRIEFVTDELN